MIRTARPPEPAEFAARVREAELHVAAIARERPPASEDFAPRWRAFKAVLAAAQHGRCGYCDLICTGHGDVEHFRPKAAVHVLAGAPSERGPPRVTTASERGWWWLAYAWSNYLLACARCNQKWKRCLFPLATPLVGPPRPDGEEEPLLLHPFDGPDPEAHLTFDRFGAILPRSAHGRATILTCGLHRRRLLSARRLPANRAHGHVDALESPVPSARMDALLALGQQGTHTEMLACVTRCIWRERRGTAWRDAFLAGPHGWDVPRAETRRALGLLR